MRSPRSAGRTLKGALIIGIVQGGLAGLGFWAVGIHGVIFWSAIMAVLSILPGTGAADAKPVNRTRWMFR